MHLCCSYIATNTDHRKMDLVLRFRHNSSLLRDLTVLFAFTRPQRMGYLFSAANFLFLPFLATLKLYFSQVLYRLSVKFLLVSGKIISPAVLKAVVFRIEWAYRLSMNMEFDRSYFGSTITMSRVFGIFPVRTIFSLSATFFCAKLYNSCLCPDQPLQNVFGGIFYLVDKH